MKKPLTKAEKILMKYDESLHKPDIIMLGKKLGFHSYDTDLFNAPLPNNIDIDSYIRGMLVSGTYIDKGIMVEQSQTAEYKRFVAAYLLSQYILDEYPNDYAKIVIDSQYDKEILSFCRDLLIPNKYFKYDLKEANIKKLSQIYTVPDFIMAQKVKVLRNGGKQ